MPRRTSRYALDTFLRQLARTGNVALAADPAGLAKSGLYKRRARDQAFAQACDAALAAFRYSPERGGGPFPAEGMVEGPRRPPKAAEGPGQLRTALGDLAFSRYAGRPQRRRMAAGRLTGLGIANFFAALANTGNIRLAAASVGVAASGIHARRRTDPGFAQEMEAAFDLAQANINCALMQAADCTFGGDWIEDVDPQGPKMTVGQAIWFASRRTTRK